MAISQSQYAEIYSIFRSQILKLVCRICMANVAYSFNVLKVNSEVKHTIGQFDEVDGSQLMGRVLRRIFNNKKKMVYNWMHRVNDESQYWKSKACILMKGLLQRRVNNMMYAGFVEIADERTNPQFPSKAIAKTKQNPEEQYIKFYVKMISKISQNAEYRILSSAFSCILSHFWNSKNNEKICEAENKDGKTMGDAYKLAEVLEVILRKFYSNAFRTIKQNLQIQQNKPQKQNQESQQEGRIDHDEQDIQISQIKSIILTVKQQKPKPKSSPQQKQYSARAIGSILSQAYAGLMQYTFHRIKWKLVQNYDEEMVEKLQTEIVECTSA